ncbi:MAG: hypothetical protein ABI539_03045 [Acidobacteriota bacterium]
MRITLTLILSLVFSALSLVSCRSEPAGTAAAPSALKDVPAVRLNFRYEPDVPAPEGNAGVSEERSPAVQADFDQNRPQEMLDRTIASPAGKRLVAVYHRVADVQAEFRMDMYSAEGKPVSKITADAMAVHFPDTIRWSPDSSSVAFVAMTRTVVPVDTTDVGPDAGNSNTAQPPAAAPPETADAHTAEANTNATNETQPPAPTPAPPAGVLTFRTEQIYLCNAEGGDVKPVTQNEGLMYFYYVWSPDSSMLAALAATAREWQVLAQRADLAGEIFVPVGRPRLVEKNGRERRLDDALTAVQPVWSPDSAKVAVGFDTQVRIYDAAGNNPTQAAIPLRNQLLISSQAYDRDQQQKLDAANSAPANAPANAAPVATPPPAAATLPDPSTLVSFNPIVSLNWTADDILYFQTAYIKRMKNETDSVTSFLRWHRLIFSMQPAATAQ